MKHRKLMIDMEHGKRFVDECENSGGDTKRIEEFANEQLKKTEQVVEEIKRMSQKSRLNIQECITEVLSVRRSLILSEISLDEKNRKTLPGNQSQAASLKKKEAKDDHDNLGFPEGMTYGHRHALRLECGRFLRFAFLVDFLALESLTNIYLNSVESMTRRLKKLNESCDIGAICAAESGDDSAALTAPRGLEPLFYVEIKLDEKPIPESMEVSRQIEDFILPPRGTSQVQDFDPLAHMVIDEPGADDDGMDGEDEEKMPEPVYQRTVPGIEKHWLETAPSCNKYVDLINKTFKTGLERLKCFERWSKHESLTPYRKQLEDWDEPIGDPWELDESLYLDPKLWVQDDPIHTNHKAVVQEVLESAFSKVDRFL